MSYKEHIFSGEDQLDPQLFELPFGYQVGVLFDPNKEFYSHPSEDVGALVITDNAALKIAIDGITGNTRDPKAGNFGFKSAKVAEAFLDTCIWLFYDQVKKGIPFHLAAMHHDAANAVHRDFESGMIQDKGGLVAISTLLLPNGLTHTHRFGDTQKLVSTATRAPFFVPEQLWPETRARDLFLSERAARINSGYPMTAEEEATRIKAMLTAKGAEGNLRRYVSADRDSPINPEENNWTTTLEIGGRELMGSDGSDLYGRELTNDPNQSLEALLAQIWERGKLSGDNILTFAVERTA